MALSDTDFERAALLVDAEPEALQAVHAVETASQAFLNDGRQKILFEGHIFWKRLVKHGFHPRKYLPGGSEWSEELGDTSNIIYQHWDKSKYYGGAREYDRLKMALLIDETSAYESASFGAFQIMGFNYQLAGYSSAKAMKEDFDRGEVPQLEGFVKFLISNKLVGHLKSKNWAAFARGYNGSAYAENKYDESIAKKYAKFVRQKLRSKGSEHKLTAPSLNKPVVSPFLNYDYTLGVCKVKPFS